MRARAARSSCDRSTRPAGSPGGCASWVPGPTASSGSTRRAARPTGADPAGNQRRSPRRSSRPARSPAITARGWPPKERSAGAACTPGGRWSTCSSGSASPRPSASRPTWPTRCSTPWAKTPPRTASCPRTSTGRDQATLDAALKTLTAALRPWTIDFHVAQNDATVFGSGSHDHTGRHCLATDPNGKLDIPHHAGFWLRDENGKLTKKLRHICWDGCMFPNAVMMKPQTWNDILAAMIASATRTAGGNDELKGPPCGHPSDLSGRGGPVTARYCRILQPAKAIGDLMAQQKPLNIGLVGYGFMGRTHSNAYKRVNDFFDVEYRPVLKAVCGRTAPRTRRRSPRSGATSRSRPTGGSWSSARISTRSTSARPTTRTPRSPSPRPRPAR